MMNFESGVDLIDYITENNLLDTAWNASPDLTAAKKVQAWFGDFVFTDSLGRPEEQIAIVYHIYEKARMVADDVDNYCVENAYQSWLIPSDYRGQIVYSEDYIKELTK